MSPVPASSCAALVPCVLRWGALLSALTAPDLFHDKSPIFRVTWY